MIGVFTDDGLIAYSAMYFPASSDDNSGIDIDLPAEELNRVAHLAKVAVHLAYRGNLLQRKMQGSHLGLIQDI